MNSDVAIITHQYVLCKSN